MIEIIPYQNLSEKNRWIEAEDFESVTLLVSDLDSKFYWQDFILKQKGYLAGSPVLRAEDLWKTLVQRNFPQINFVSRPWVTSLLRELLRQDLAEKCGLPYVKPSSVLKALNEFLPIVCHPEADEIMEHWWTEVKPEDCSWKPWLILSQQVWNEFFHRQSIMSEWSASFLVHHNTFSYLGDRELLVDLGSELRPIEVELLQSISTQFRVRVLTPQADWMKSYPWVIFPYKQFLTRSHKVAKIQRPTVNFENKILFKRFTSTLAEVKFVVGQIQQWLQQGSTLNEIAIIAPDIEYYWPILSWHLRQDGIPFERGEKLKVGSLGTVLAWIATLKQKTFDALSFAEYELAEFHPYNKQTRTFIQEWSRWSKRNKIPKQTSSPSDQQKISAMEFLSWATSIRYDFSETILKCLQKWLMEAETLEARSGRDWVEYLEDFLNQQEIEWQPKSPDALGVYSLASVIPSRKTRHIFLGCSESQLKSSQGMVSGADVMSLLHHTGLLLSHPDRDFREYQLQILQGSAVEQIYTFAETDFSGTELVPSVLWLNGREKQNVKTNQVDEWTPGSWESMQLGKTQALTSRSEVKLQTPWEFSLSPSSLKSYVECPFKFFAEKGLKLVDPEVVDLDLDPRSQGSLQHHLLELLVVEPFNSKERQEQLPELIESLIKQHEDKFYSEPTKELIKQQLLHLGMRFLQHEESYRQQFPKFYSLACEAWYERDIDIGKKKIKFRGKIDRIDAAKDQQAMIVIDYKSDIGKYRGAASWIQNQEFQMPAYVSSVEGGFVSFAQGDEDEMQNIPPTPVVAAHYYDLKDFERKGFTLEGVDAGVVSTPSSKSTITGNDKLQLIKEFESVLINSAQQMALGEFSAIPHPSTECLKCSWRSLCRIPTPNL